MEKTLTILKPDAVEKNIVGDVLAQIEADGLEIKALKMTQLSRAEAREFYGEHEGSEFFEGLVDFMTSGPVVLAIITGEDAISRLRTLMGATDPSEAAPGTIRAEFDGSLPNNIIHGSDSPESAQRERTFFFPNRETVGR